MQRPTNVTENIEALEKSFDENPEIPDFVKKDPFRGNILEVYLVNIWLEDRLTELGIPKEIRDKICEATGQQIAMTNNHWGDAHQAFEQAKLGKSLKAGFQLSQELLREDLTPTYTDINKL